MKINIVFCKDDQVLKTAASELQRFIHQASTDSVTQNAPEAEKSDLKIVLEPGCDLPEGSFALKSEPGVMRLRGFDSAGVLHAAYELLEAAGYFFEITGPIAPAAFDLTRAFKSDTLTVPAVLHRGVRQHINFPMDISSYTLKEAREYIRNMARMKYNHITFHSYNGQWIPAPAKDGFVPGGNFFYGCRHDIPDCSVIKDNVNNRVTYCIPEIEEMLDAPEKRQELAFYWLRNVMLEAKSYGMTVQLSIEPPLLDPDVNIKACQDVLTTYPMIDIFELVTPECGGETRRLPIADELALTAEFFGKEIYDDAALIALYKDNCRQLPGVLRNISVSLKIIGGLKTDKKITIGVYATEHQTLIIARYLLRKFVPENVLFAFLPSHGAAAALTSVKMMEPDSYDVAKTMFYSWAEFDGNMYLLQNPSTALHGIQQYLSSKSADGRIYGLCLNHWRTCENKPSLDYAARAFIYPDLLPEDFSRMAAKAYGIKDVEKFVEMMDALEKTDEKNQGALFNIGFCYIDCWLANPGLGWSRRYNTGLLDEFIQFHEQTLDKVRACMAAGSAVAGIGFMRLMINRLECAVIHFRCMRELSQLHPICDDNDPSAISEQNKKYVTEKCDRAMEFAFEYMEKQAEVMPDRGCEGNLISYYITIPVYIDHIKQVFTVGETECRHATKKFDSPPSPFIL